MKFTPSPVSLLSQYFLSNCYNKSIVDKVLTYSSEISKDGALLNATRQSFLAETEATILSFKDMHSIHQISTKIRHLSLSVQYFIFERAIVLSKYEIFHRDPLEDFLDIENKSCHILYALLQPLWDDTVKHLEDSGTDINTHLSNLIHQNY